MKRCPEGQPPKATRGGGFHEAGSNATATAGTCSTGALPWDQLE